MKVCLVPHPKTNSTLPREVDAKKKAYPGVIGGRFAKAAARAGVPKQKRVCWGCCAHPTLMLLTASPAYPCF